MPSPLWDDGNSFFKNKAEYQKVFNGLTSQGNTVLKRLRKVIDSDKDRWRRYQKEKAEATPKPPPKATGRRAAHAAPAALATQRINPH